MTTRLCALNRNGSFGFGASLGGLFVVAVLALAPMATRTHAACFGDLTGPAGILDGTVGLEDLQAVTASWGNYQSAADLDGDISTPVGVPDLLLLLGAWGDCPNPCDQNPCQEGCTFDVCDVNGPCYDYSACLDIRCAENDCYSEECPGYCWWCGDDPCYGPCYDEHECCAIDCTMCNPVEPGCFPEEDCDLDPCQEGCPWWPCL